MDALLAAPVVQESFVIRLKQSSVFMFDGGYGAPTKNNKQGKSNLEGKCPN